MTSQHPSFSRRRLIKASAIALAAGAAGASTVGPAQAHTQALSSVSSDVLNAWLQSQSRGLGPILGTVLDYSAGVPSGAAVKAAGHLGAVRYVSAARPDASWMLGKPVRYAETSDFKRHGLGIASVYQFGRADTADWLQGAAGARRHGPEAIKYHRAAGGPTNRPIYVAIDDNPSRAQYTQQIRPYLQEFGRILNNQGYILGIYGNYNVIDWAIADGLGKFFWMHNWGSDGKIHPRTTIHQYKNNIKAIDGVAYDLNNVYARDWGQW